MLLFQTQQLVLTILASLQRLLVNTLQLSCYCFGTTTQGNTPHLRFIVSVADSETATLVTVSAQNFDCLFGSTTWVAILDNTTSVAGLNTMNSVTCFSTIIFVSSLDTVNWSSVSAPQLQLLVQIPQLWSPASVTQIWYLVQTLYFNNKYFIIHAQLRYCKLIVCFGTRTLVAGIDIATLAACFGNTNSVPGLDTLF